MLAESCPVPLYKYVRASDTLFASVKVRSLLDKNKEFSLVAQFLKSLWLPHGAACRITLYFVQMGLKRTMAPPR